MIASQIFADRATSILPELVSGRGTARRSRVVEGQACARSVDDARGASVGIAQDIGGGNAKRFDSGCREEFIAFRIANLGEIACRIIRTAQILPGTGRGTMRSMVEGARLSAGLGA